MSEFIFLHPYGNPSEDEVPAGAVGCVNASGPEFRGLYAREITPGDIAGCKLVAMDLQWFHSLPAFSAIAAELKRLNPGLKIVAGGITAGMMSKYLLSETVADYVLIGYSEAAFSALVRLIAAGKTVPDDIPGLLTRNNPMKDPAETRDAQSLENLDAHTIAWFPSLRQATAEIHEKMRSADLTRADFDHYFPFVPVMRGCETGCPGCYGSYGAVFYPGAPIIRSSASIKSALEAIENNPEYSFVNFIGDFLTRTDLDTARAALPVASRLFCSYHFCELPDAARLDTLLSAFAFSRIFLILREKDFAARQQDSAANWRRLESLLEAFAGRGSLKITLDALSADVLEKCGAIEKDFPSVQVKDNREWHINKPDERTYNDNDDFALSRKFFSWASEFQTSNTSYKLTSREAKKYAEPHELPSDNPDNAYLPGLSRPPFRCYPVMAIPGIDKGAMKPVQFHHLRRIGPFSRFDIRFGLNALLFECVIDVRSGLNAEYFALEYAPDEAVREHLKNRIVRTPVFRLLHPVGTGEDETLNITVSCPGNDKSVRISSGGEILLEVRTPALFGAM